ncbi:MAG TPA: 2-phospho-L-lactate guanylyltransferase [Candidatus Limnocylindrales bacterium]|nr:2-phospho-L-lactate guanylyltransferase [Candidatus Limnocylindrales bacterium]
MEPTTPVDLSRVWAVVPIRGLRTAKTRLSPDLDPAERLALVTEMLRRTLVATSDAPSIEGTVVVTLDPAVAGIATAHRAVGLVDILPGLNEAILAARSLAISRQASAVLILPADLPSVTAERLDALVADARAALAGAGPDAVAQGLVAVVPDRHREGTNALLVAPASLIDPDFGPGSLAAHRAAAAAVGAFYLEIGGPLTLDVDTPADLLLASATLGAANA